MTRSAVWNSSEEASMAGAELAGGTPEQTALD